MKPLFLCYDSSRFPQARALALSGQSPLIVWNPNEGFKGDKPFLTPWVSEIHFCKSRGAKCFGYINLLDTHGKSKPIATIDTEIRDWLTADVDKIFLDDARVQHKGMIATLVARYKSIVFLANPGSFVEPLRSIRGLALLEQEDASEKVKLLSKISIFFVRPERLAQIRESARKTCMYAAFEPFDTYHKPGVEFQKALPTEYLKF